MLAREVMYWRISSIPVSLRSLPKRSMPKSIRRGGSFVADAKTQRDRYRLGATN